MLTLMDKCLAMPHGKRKFNPPSEHLRRIEGASHTAKRFMFSDEASKLAGGLAFGPTSKLVLNNRQFAVPPYNNIYIEFNSRIFHSSVLDDTTDFTIGYLYSDSFLYSFVGADDNSIPVIGLLAYVIVPPKSKIPAQGNIILMSVPEGTSRENIIEMNNMAGKYYLPNEFAKYDVDHKGMHVKLAVALGTTMTQIEGDEQMDDLNNEIGLEWMLEVPKNPSGITRMLSYFRQCAGDVRNFWTLLLWINRPSKVIRRDYPAGAKLFKGKRVSYSKHQVIDIDLNKKQYVYYANSIKLEERASPLLHEVRGHFKHTGGDITCSHDWPLVADRHHHWTCNKCQRMRWWAKDHHRGDASKGVNISDYTVSVDKQ